MSYKLINFDQLTNSFFDQLVNCRAGRLVIQADGWLISHIGSDQRIDPNVAQVNFRKIIDELNLITNGNKLRRVMSLTTVFGC